MLQKINIGFPDEYCWSTSYNLKSSVRENWKSFWFLRGTPTTCLEIRHGRKSSPNWICQEINDCERVPRSFVHVTSNTVADKWDPGFPTQAAISRIFGTVAETRINRVSFLLFIREITTSSVLPLDSFSTWTYYLWRNILWQNNLRSNLVHKK